MVFGVPRGFIDALEADDLGHLRIGVQAVEVIAFLRQRLQDRLVREALRKGAIVVLAGHEVEIGVDFAHPSMLGAEHGFELGV